MKHLDIIYSSKAPKQKNKKSPPINKIFIHMYSPFFDELPKGNHSSSKGGGGGNRLKLSNFTRNAYSSVSTSTKSWPWAA